MIELESFFRPTQEVALKALKCEKAKELAQLLNSNVLNFVRLIECRIFIDAPKLELVTFAVEVERSQKIVNDIKAEEIIAVLFDPSDKSSPEVLALREDFPKTPHTNLRLFEKPKSLCLYDRPYTEIKHFWSAARFIKQIQRWLTDTCSGTLHGNDQPLEPLFENPKVRLIIHENVVKNPDDSMPLHLSAIELNGNYTLFANGDGAKNKNEIEFLATILTCPTIEHGLINKRPKTIKELHDFLSLISVDLIKILKERLSTWLDEKKISGLLDKKFILIILFPKSRSSGTSVEATDIYSFISCDSISKIGEEIGLWQMTNGIPGRILDLAGSSANITDKNGLNLHVDLCSTMFSFSREMAAKLNGVELEEKLEISLIGAGALGSQVFMNLIRSGYGTWNIIDEDVLLPHNLSRHSLLEYDVGHSKAYGLARHANYMFHENIVKKAIADNLIEPLKHEDDIKSALKSSDVILDCSASTAVSKYLSKESDVKNRIISCFLNPSGKDLIVLAEDSNKEYPIDMIEMQYYRQLIIEPKMSDHLTGVNQQGLRYSNSCRDISSTVAQDYFSMHAAIASRVIKEVIKSKEAFASIWCYDSSDHTIHKQPVPLEKIYKLKIGKWVVYFDDYFIGKIRQFRQERLPNETGGVLIGSFDLKDKVIYMTDTILSPPDSKEWPTTYVRGCEGLSEDVKKIQTQTFNNLEYVGEWHSHPQDVSCMPSNNDREAFSWLIDLMNVEGLPAIMLIVGDDNFTFYIENM